MPIYFFFCQVAFSLKVMYVRVTLFLKETSAEKNISLEFKIYGYHVELSNCLSMIKTPKHIFQLCLTITKITINGLSQLNFESETIVIFVIVNHMCAQLEDLLHTILRARF